MKNICWKCKTVEITEIWRDINEDELLIGYSCNKCGHNDVITRRIKILELEDELQE